MTVEVVAKKAHLLQNLKQMTIKIDQTRTTDVGTNPLKIVVATRAKKVQTIINLVTKVEDVTHEAQRLEHRVINLRKVGNNRKLLKSLTTTGNSNLNLRKSNKEQTRTMETVGPNLCRSRGKGP